jgi:DMSO/TMAO reductase YedYZ molybdopterin-dependent catalytic subunit
MPGQSRRKFIGRVLFVFGGLVLLLEPTLSFWSEAWGKLKRKVLSRETRRNSLVNENPGNLDARNFEITPLEDFATMGLSDHPVELNHWTLKVEGLVQTPLRLSYEQIRAFPFLERKVLMICPGFFVNQGLWKGISIRTLLQKAGTKPGVNHVSINGPEGPYTKTERFPLKDILSDKVFLAYQVNGSDLPQKHGFPLRLVAEDSYGDSWVKYVDTIKVEKV